METDIICPISKQIFKEPVVASDGYIYEKECIEKWLEKKTTSPMTNELLSHTKLNHVQFLKNIINEMIKKNPELIKEQYGQFEEHLTTKEEIYSAIITKKMYDKILELKDIDSILLFNILEYNMNHNALKEFLKKTKIIIHIIDNCIDINVPITAVF